MIAASRLRLSGIAVVAAWFVASGDVSAVGPPVPELTGRVVDSANVIGAGEAAAVENLSRELQEKTGAQIAVLTIPTVKPLDTFDYGMQVVDRWKLGSEEKDDGLLLLVVTEDRYVRFFQGYGLEGILSDGKLGRILDDYVTPLFKEGRIGAGVHAGMRAVADVIATDAGVELTGQSVFPARKRSRDLTPQQVRFLLLVFIVVLVIAAQGGGRRRRVRGGPVYWGGGGFGGGFGGGWGGGFGGGGFGGGGGGFGGGGAGRGW